MVGSRNSCDVSNDALTSNDIQATIYFSAAFIVTRSPWPG
jgi:hypothetical protein